MKKEVEAQLKLAEAMARLADRLEKFQDPVLWQKTISDATRTMPGFERLLQPAQPVVLGELPSGRVEGVSVSVSLSDEEKEKLANKVYEAVKPQLQEFNQFVQDSLKEMPAHRLRDLAEKIEAGEKPEIKRRHGCVFIVAGDTEVYLGM